MKCSGYSPACRPIALTPLDIHAVWPKTRYMPLKIRCAIDALVAGIPALLAD